MGDVDAIVDHYVRVAEEGRWIAGEAPVDREERRLAFLGSIGADDVLTLVAEDEDGAVVGMLFAFARESRGVAELGMSVDAEVRRRGIGTALLDGCEDWARGRGLHKLALEVFPHNDAALALYRKAGFEEEGRLREHYRRASGELWDVVVMGRRLGDT